MRATISILGLYTWDNTIFDNIIIPEGVSKGELVTNILARCAELECLYSSPVFFKKYVEAWSFIKNVSWARKYKALTLEYNPIENYERNETITETINENGNGTQSGNAEEDVKNATYDGALATANKQINDNELNSEYANKHDRTYNNFTHGNIGVTTSQQMLEQEMNIADYNIYDIIIDDFKKDFCLGVY